MAKVSFGMRDMQHKDWFITSLVPHIHILLMQQKIASQAEALEIMMKLEASPIDKIRIGMNQIQLQLANLTIQFQDIKKEKEVREEV